MILRVSLEFLVKMVKFDAQKAQALLTIHGRNTMNLVQTWTGNSFNLIQIYSTKRLKQFSWNQVKERKSQ